MPAPRRRVTQAGQFADWYRAPGCGEGFDDFPPAARQAGQPLIHGGAKFGRNFFVAACLGAPRRAVDDLGGPQRITPGGVK